MDAPSPLHFQRCGDCGGITHTPGVLCAHCASRALTWEASAGDHELCVGRVRELDVGRRGIGPLVFFRGGYGRFEP